MLTLKIALLQMASCGRDVAANLHKGDRFCRRAVASGAHVALFPELWSIGYQGFSASKPAEKEAWLASAIARDDAFVEHFRHLARELGIAIGITYLERWPGAPRNAFTLFDGHGEEVFTYAKVHLCPWDPSDNACTPGDDFPVGPLETPAGVVRVGGMICFDREFPEAARMLMLNGAELILTPNACDLDEGGSGFGDVRIAQFRSRAFENLVAVAMVNYAAPQNDGRSVAFYPDGGLVVLADVDLARVGAVRASEMSRDAARCPEKYAAISAPRVRRGV